MTAPRLTMSSTIPIARRAAGAPPSTLLAGVALALAACGGGRPSAPAPAPQPAPPAAGAARGGAASPSGAPAPSAAPDTPSNAAPATGAARAAAPARVDPMAAALAEARTLASRGDVASARVIVDSLLGVTLPGSDAQAEGLFWRATFAESAEEAERDYLRVVRSHPMSAWAGDANVRLAQLELMRRRPAEARRHLDRALTTAPNPQAEARARLWMSRTQLAEGDPLGACRSLVRADALATPGGELARQVSAFESRLPGCELAIARAARARAASASNVAARPRATPPAAVPANAATSAPTSSTAPSAASAPAALRDTGRFAQRSTPASPSVRDTAARVASGAVPNASPGAPPNASPTMPPPTRVVVAPGAPPKAAAPAPARPPAAAPTAASAPAASAASGPFTVQLAAYPSRAGADRFAATLRRDGLDARVYAQGAAADRPPFRVRVGYYRTRSAARAALGALQRQGHEGFVIETEPGAGGAR